MRTCDWRAFVWDAHRLGAVTRTARDVLLTLATFDGGAGRIWPSHERLAERVRCSVRTVQRAMDMAREAGLLTWKAIRWRNARGIWRRKSNLYRLCAPPTGQIAGRGENRVKRKKEAREDVNKPALRLTEEQQARGDDEEARKSVRRQLRALGFPLPFIPR